MVAGYIITGCNFHGFPDKGKGNFNLRGTAVNQITGDANNVRLRIFQRISSREDIELIVLSEDKRKDTQARKEALNSCDIAFLCLPDDAAREAVALVENPNTVIIVPQQ